MKKFNRATALLTAVSLVATMSACGNKEKDDTKDTVSDQKDVEEEKKEEVTPTPATKEKEEEKKDEKEEKEETVEKISLKVWAPQEEQLAYEGYGDSLLAYMCEAFDEDHPEWDIEFTYGAIPENECKTELMKDPAAGANVFMFASDQTSFLVENEILAPITIESDKVIEENGGSTSGSIQGATFNDMLYAVPFTPNSWFMYYDKSKFNEDEVKSLDTMMSKDLGEGVSNFCIDLDNGWYNASFFFAGGCQLFGADGKDATNCTFNDENGIEVGNYLIDLAKNPRFLEEGESGGNAIAALTEGKLGAWCSGTWNAENVKKALGDNYAAAKLPSITLKGKECQLKSFADYKYIGVNLDTDPKAMEAAIALAVYLGNEDCQKIRFLTRSIAPTITSLASDPSVTANPAVAALSEQSSCTQFQSTISQMKNFWDPAKALGAGIYNGEITKDNLKEQLDTFVSNVLTALN